MSTKKKSKQKKSIIFHDDITYQKILNDDSNCQIKTYFNQITKMLIGKPIIQILNELN